MCSVRENKHGIPQNKPSINSRRNPQIKPSTQISLYSFYICTRLLFKESVM